MYPVVCTGNNTYFTVAEIRRKAFDIDTNAPSSRPPKRTTPPQTITPFGIGNIPSLLNPLERTPAPYCHPRPPRRVRTPPPPGSSPLGSNAEPRSDPNAWSEVPQSEASTIIVTDIIPSGSVWAGFIIMSTVVVGAADILDG